MSKFLLKLAAVFLLVNTFMPADISAQGIPYVYSIENTGASYPAPPLPPLANCPRIDLLPDPFAWANDPMGSTRSTAFSDWSRHRAEIKAQIENYEIGTKPAVDPSQVTATYSGGSLTVRVTVNGRTLTLTSTVTLPSGSGPFPAVIGMNSANGSLPANAFTSRNIARITFNHDQVTTYNSPSNSNPYYLLYPALNIDNTGQYSAWAWGVSRIIDGLYKLQGTLPIDLNHIAVTGCSYAGKMALFAGALDERIALTIAQESGGGGAPCWRYSQTEPSGSVEGLGQTSHQWFKEDMFQFAGANVSYLPEDHHMLMAMCAPRALFITGNTDYTWLSNPSCYVSGRAVQKIYSTLGIADRFGFAITGGHSHCAFPSSLDADLGYFLDKFMKGNTSLTRTVQTYPSSYANIDYARWYQWWGTNGSNKPPVANAGPDQTITDSDNNGNQSVTLNGSGSSDPDGTISSYVWKEDSTQIATGVNPSVTLTVGTHTITLTVTDNSGATASDNVVITVNTGSSGSSDIWLEAECGTVGPLWNVSSDANASNSKYVTIQSGNNSTGNAPGSSTGYITYSFNVSESGNYGLWGRVIAPSGNDDSFWVRMDNGSWFNWNNITFSTSWVWDDCQPYSLTAGSHTLTIAYREDGCLLDKILITKSGGTPSGVGSAAGNCGSTGSYSITVRARGIAGSEQIRLTIGGTTIQTWTLTTSLNDYIVTTSNSGATNVEFINDDGTVRDVQVDYIQVDGTTLQAEAQATNTGVWQNSTCGGSNSEWLHCNGYIAFGSFKSAYADKYLTINKKHKELSIYPNPASDKLMIEFPKAPESNVEMNIYTITGAQVKSIFTKEKITTIETGSFEKGIYYLIINQNNKTTVEKFIKQ